MEIKSVPRIMIAGTSSGCGKTTVTCAILQILKNMNIGVSSFKCGPDYIDPMFHSKVIGVKSSNLDMYFCCDNIIKQLFAENSTDMNVSTDMNISVIEGVMGFYDGRSMNTTEASSYALSKMLETPVILTIDCKGMANSVFAVIKGFAELYPDNTIAGVILNNIRDTTYERIKNAYNGKLKFFGYLPKLPDDLILKSRHLGLVTADEITDLQDKLIKLAELTSKTIDIESIIETANQTSDISYEKFTVNRHESVKIAVANDNAFCFYYRDNLELLEKIGAELIYFSPLNDSNLPENIHGIYIGGGYPELYTDKLSANKSMLQSVKNALDDKIPCIAECGGFMYLNKSIDNREMVGYLKGECYNNGKLTRFGYKQLSETVRGHEFHYYECTQHETIWNNDGFYAGFPHIHFYSDVNFALDFYNKCIERKNNHEADGYRNTQF